MLLIPPTASQRDLQDRQRTQCATRELPPGVCPETEAETNSGGHRFIPQLHQFQLPPITSPLRGAVASLSAMPSMHGAAIATPRGNSSERERRVDRVN